MNPYLILSGIGMLIVGALAPLIWWWKKGTEIEFFIYGLLLWVIAISPKFLMDFTITKPLSQSLLVYGNIGYVVVMGLYVGLRTGLLESGLSYIVIRKTRMRGADLNRAIAIGIGFGAIEAIFIGFSSFINTLVFLLYPGLIDKIPESQRDTVIQQLNQSSLMIPAPILERTFVIVIHIFALLLVFYAIKTSKIKYLIASVIYKTVVDGPIPAFQTYLNLNMPGDTYIVEAYFGILALIGLLGIEKIMEKWKHHIA